MLVELFYKLFCFAANQLSELLFHLTLDCLFDWGRGYSKSYKTLLVKLWNSCLQDLAPEKLALNVGWELL